MSSVIGIDIGGTFTDLSAFDPKTGQLIFEKTATTPAPDEGALSGLQMLRDAGFAVHDAEALKHGTTVVINSVLERQGAKTALITTKGFRDVLEISRGNRPEAFNLFFRRLPPLVPRDLRFEITERVSSNGEVLTPLDRDALPLLAEKLKANGIEAVAICFLHAYRNPAHEREVADYVAAHTTCFVTASHELSREFREYERTSTAVINAFVGPRTANYLDRFKHGAEKAGFCGQVLLMGSAGGVLTADEATRRPVLLIESGPVGGAAGAAEIGRLTGNSNVIAFDMGGTTAKAVMIENGEAAVTPVYYAAGYSRGYPVQAAVLDIIEVGAGGGSIASINALGVIEVGPRSAAAFPGPACYGNGGTEPTVTDANLVLGRLNPANFLGGEMALDVGASETAIAQIAAQMGQSVQRVAAGILHIVTLTMASAVRMTTLERGHDPRDFAMIAYGGAGPLHATAIAREIGIKSVIIPNHPGHFCAFGMLHAELRYDFMHTVARPLDVVKIGDIRAEFDRLEQQGRAELARVAVKIMQVKIVRNADMRYQNQEHTIKIRLPDGELELDARLLRELFEEGYARRYGHCSPSLEVDLVNLRISVDGIPERPPFATMDRRTGTPKAMSRQVYFEDRGSIDCAVWQRDELPTDWKAVGPAIIEETASTTVLLPGDSVRLDEYGNIHIAVGQDQ